MIDVTDFKYQYEVRLDLRGCLEAVVSLEAAIRDYVSMDMWVIWSYPRYFKYYTTQVAPTRIENGREISLVRKTGGAVDLSELVSSTVDFVPRLMQNNIGDRTWCCRTVTHLLDLLGHCPLNFLNCLST